MAATRESPHFFVPDLSPMDRPQLKGLRPRVVFVAESPHSSEIAPEAKLDRRPLCGAAGRKWWSAIGEILEGEPSEDCTLERMLRLCRQHGLVVLNAVQFPLDTAICKTNPAADPLSVVRFCKNPGAHSYKKLKASDEVRGAVEALKKRLKAPEVADAAIYPLGNDAWWFVKQALSPTEFEIRVRGKIPHPSAWWRKGGHFGRVAKTQLKEILR